MVKERLPFGFGWVTAAGALGQSNHVGSSVLVGPSTVPCRGTLPLTGVCRSRVQVSGRPPIPRVEVVGERHPVANPIRGATGLAHSGG
jgi:hypothetical protein